MLIIELIAGHPVQPSTMATIMAIFIAASLGASLALLIYSFLDSNGPDLLPPDLPDQKGQS